MSIFKRISEAYVKARDALHMEGAIAIYDATMESNPREVVEYKKPNLLYVGNEELLAMRTEAEMVRSIVWMHDGTSHFQGMLIVPVRMDSWLQITYVEGVK